MRAIAIIFLALGACYSTTRASPYFKGLGDDAKDFVARSAPEATWTTRLRTEPGDKGAAKLPSTQILAFDTDRTLSEAEASDLIERLEFQIVRSLFSGHVRLVARRDHAAQPGVRGVTWEYEADDRRGFITFFGVRRDPGYEVIFSVCETGFLS